MISLLVFFGIRMRYQFHRRNLKRAQITILRGSYLNLKPLKARNDALKSRLDDAIAVVLDEPTVKNALADQRSAKNSHG
jgi:hypothetical protein